MDPYHASTVAVASVFGLVVGSFSNVAIHRLPLEGETVSRPRRSRCPSCRTELTWRENVPVLSWLVQRGRCRTCGWRIPLRYPLVELLTAFLWGLAAHLTVGPALAAAAGEPEIELGMDVWGLWLLRSVVLSGLVVATFVDFDHFEIPDEVSIGGIVLAPLASLLLPELHRSTWIAHSFSAGAAGGTPDRLGALLGSLAGIVVGGGALWGIGWLGKRVYARDAMGFGDVKLLAAGGGFVGPGGAMVALLIGALVASVVGLANMLRFLCLTRRRAWRRGARQRFGRALLVARVAGRYLPFGPYLGLGIGIALLDWNDVVRVWSGFVP